MSAARRAREGATWRLLQPKHGKREPSDRAGASLWSGRRSIRREERHIAADEFVELLADTLRLDDTEAVRKRAVAAIRDLAAAATGSLDAMAAQCLTALTESALQDESTHVRAPAAEALGTVAVRALAADRRDVAEAASTRGGASQGPSLLALLDSARGPRSPSAAPRSSLVAFLAPRPCSSHLAPRRQPLASQTQ